MKILFPRHELDKKKVDDQYMEEHHAAKLQMHDCYTFDYDAFAMSGDGFISNIPDVEDESPLILRCNMLSVPQYEEIYDVLKNKGYVLINTPEQYKNCHHFPESYDYTKKYTSKSIFIKKWDDSILQDISDFFEGKDFILKDFVKSEKQNPELFIMSGGISGEDLLDKVERFVEARGKDFNEGLVFKEFVNLKKYGNNSNEWRLFFYEKRLISCSQNSNVKTTECSPPYTKIAENVASQIDSNFFTIDIAEKEDGRWTIIETGDGQVSDTSPGQNCLEFYLSMEGVLKE